MVEQHQKERVSTNSLLRRLKLKSLDSVLRCNRLRWFGHVKRGELYNGQIWTWKWKETEVVPPNKVLVRRYQR